ncbi:ABC-type uncharacterized transport system permease subunit [Rhizobium sp. BK049]|nr:hypothetical protein [Rhizobium sp. BK049]MBB3354240.1 ABC-type uncharacterized transport system permease subunit [Rhizobium sp. BK049]
MPNHSQLAAIGLVFVNLFSGVLAPLHMPRYRCAQALSPFS